MRKMFAAVAVAASLLTATAAWAFAPQDFALHNNTGQAILTLAVSPSGEAAWGPDILGVDVMPAGASGEITFDRDEDQCLWDIHVTYEDGDEGDWRQINLCETTDISLE